MVDCTPSSLSLVLLGTTVLKATVRCRQDASAPAASMQTAEQPASASEDPVLAIQAGRQDPAAVIEAGEGEETSAAPATSGPGGEAAAPEASGGGGERVGETVAQEASTSGREGGRDDNDTFDPRQLRKFTCTPMELNVWTYDRKAEPATSTAKGEGLALLLSLCLRLCLGHHCTLFVAMA